MGYICSGAARRSAYYIAHALAWVKAYAFMGYAEAAYLLVDDSAHKKKVKIPQQLRCFAFILVMQQKDINFVANTASLSILSECITEFFSGMTVEENVTISLLKHDNR